jgi:hypothetical protein
LLQIEERLSLSAKKISIFEFLLLLLLIYKNSAGKEMGYINKKGDSSSMWFQFHKQRSPKYLMLSYTKQNNIR